MASNLPRLTASRSVEPYTSRHAEVLSVLVVVASFFLLAGKSERLFPVPLSGLVTRLVVAVVLI